MPTLDSVKREDKRRTLLASLNELIDSLCGVYTRVARRLGVHRTFVSRVARGERRSEPVEDALIAEYAKFRGKSGK